MNKTNSKLKNGRGNLKQTHKNYQKQEMQNNKKVNIEKKLKIKNNKTTEHNETKKA